jgi:hypothetical protein
MIDRTRLRKGVRDLMSAPPEKVTGGYGVVPGAKHMVNTNAPLPAQKFTKRDADNLMQAEMLTAMRELVESTTELTSLIGRQGTLNGVLRVGTYKFNADGVMELSHPVTVGSALIFNPSDNPSDAITVQLGPGAAAATPGYGQGFQYVPGGRSLPVAVGQKAIVLYGQTDGLVCVQAFTGLQAFGIGATL